MTGWISELQRQFRLVVYRYEKIPQGIWMETNRGPVVFNEVPSVYINKAPFVKDVYQAMGQSPFLLPLYPNAEDEMVTTLGDRTYSMMRWPATESDWLDYGWLGNSLARFHRASAKTLGQYQSPFSDLEAWPKLWKSRVDVLNKYQRTAENRLDTEEEDPFDSFFLENFDYLSRLGQLSLVYLHDSNYRYVCHKTYKYGKLSYVHFGHEQFIVTPQGNIFFVDPFGWVGDMRARDIGQFIKADVRDNGWNPQHIYSFLRGYQAISPLMPEEFTVMYALFLLPGRLMKKCESMYYRPSFFKTESPELELFRDETESMTPYQAYVEMKRNEILLREFPRFIEDTHGVVIPRME